MAPRGHYAIRRESGGFLIGGEDVLQREHSLEFPRAGAADHGQERVPVDEAERVIEALVGMQDRKSRRGQDLAQLRLRRMRRGEVWQ